MAETIALTVDAEFESLCPPLSKGEREKLERNLIDDGRAYDPIIVWANHGDIIVDGHNRYAICCEQGLAFQVKRLNFGTREDVKEWIIAHQLGRRNLTPEQRAALIGAKYNAEKSRKGAPSGNENAAKNQIAQSEPIESEPTADRVAREQNVSRETVKRDGKYAEALDKIAEACGPQARKAILDREVKSTRADVLKLAELPAELQQAVIDRLDETKNLATAIAEATRDRKRPPGGVNFEPGEWDEAAAVEEAEATVLLADKVGGAVPEHLRPVFTDADRFDALCRSISKIKSEVRELAAERAGHYIRLQQVEAELDNARKTLKFSAPHAVCPYCTGSGCEACGQSGWVHKLIYDQAPPEKRKAVAK